MKPKRILSFFVTFALLVGLLPWSVMPARAADITLPNSDNCTANDGDVLTGSTSGTVTIAGNANITLNNATINGGIVCEGSATITLVGTNSVSGATNKAGIEIGGSGTTLTIRGEGSLSATGGNQSAGIGLSRIWNYDSNVSSGDIVIEGGTITATGGSWGAGIGIGTVKNTNNDNSTSVQFGNITIKGGSVTAIGGDSGDGIGKGYSYTGPAITFGTVTIYDGIDKVDASSIKNFGSVVYMHGETDITASASTYFTIIEDGDRRIIEKKDDTDYTITILGGIEHGTLTGATTAKYGEKVTITATPDSGYRLTSLVVKDVDNNDVASTGNSFFMPKSNVTVSAFFEQGTHGTTEFVLGYFGQSGVVRVASIYDGLTTVNLQQGQSYQIFTYNNASSYRKFLLDNSTYDATIPYSGGTGTFPEQGNGTHFNVDYNGGSGFYDITMTDVGNGKWSVSILKTVAVMDAVPDQTYTGSEITPEPLVLAGSLSLTKGTDYEYSYTNNTNAGTATVTVTFKGDYSTLGSVEKEFHIYICKTVSDPTITVAEATYTGNALEPTVTVKDDDTEIPSDEYTVSYTNNTNAALSTDANAPTVTITDKEGGSYIVNGSTTFTINPKPVTITGLSASEKVYDGTTTATVTGTAVIDGKVGSDDVSVDTSAGTATFDSADVGTGKTVTFSGYALSGESAGNYTLSGQPANVTASITAKPITIKAADQSVELNGEIVTGTDKVSVTSGSLVDVHSITSVTLTPSSNANVTTSGTITPSAAIIKDASGNDVTRNYAITYASGKLTVTKVKARVTTAPTANNRTYDGTAADLLTGGTANTSLEYSTNGTNYSATVPQGTNADTYTVYYRAAADGNHDASDAVEMTVTIAKATLTVTTNNKTITYGDAPANDGVSYDGFVGIETSAVLGGTLAYAYSYEQYGNVGSSYTITPSGLTSDNYEISFVAGTLTVEQKEVGLTWNSTPLTFDGTAQAPTATATGTVNSDAISVTVSGGRTNAGTGYTATASGLTGPKAGNYKLPAEKTTTFSIGKASHSNQTASGSAKFGAGGTVDLSALIVSGGTASIASTTDSDSVLSDTPAVEDSKLNFTFKNEEGNAGKTATVAVKVTSQNYEDYNITITLTVLSKNAINPTVTLAGWTYGDAAKTPSVSGNTGNGTVTYAYKLKNADTYTDTVPTNAGEYTVKATVAETTDYGAGEALANFTINKANVTGNPTFTKITESGKTLADASLAKGTITADGTLSWDDGNSTTVEQGKAYGWTFTPTDTANYNIKAGTLIPWAKPASGGGSSGGGGSNGGSSSSGGSSSGSSSGASSTTTTTTTNPDGSTTKTTTNADGSKTAVTTAQDGSTGTVKTDAQGNTVSAEAAPSAKAISDAAAKGEAVTLPVAVKATTNAASAVPVSVTLPAGSENVTVEIPVENLTAGTVAVIVHADGTEEIVKTSTTGADGVVLTLDGSATVKIVDNTKSFGDVTGSEWYADSVAWAASHEVMNGMGDGDFSPDSEASRAQIAQLLFNLDGATADGNLASFGDVNAGDWYADAVTWMVENGIASGMGDDFDANEDVTREQLAVMLYNYAKYKGYETSASGSITGFPDAGDADGYARSALAWAVAAGLINGTTDETGNIVLDPQGSATRAQIAAIIERFCENVAK